MKYTKVHFLNEKQLNLLKFVAKKHEGQKRKYTNKDYIEHPIEVAEMVSVYRLEFPAIEVALCHDLLEDTPCTKWQLWDHLILQLDYSKTETNIIVKGVEELSNFYTEENCPSWDRAKRKAAEAERLSRISSISQSVKYCDLINNCSTIVDRDPEFAKGYLKEKKDVLRLMNKGNFDLYLLACYYLQQGLNKLSLNNEIKL